MSVSTLSLEVPGCVCVCVPVGGGNKGIRERVSPVYRCQCLGGACDWLLQYVPLLTRPPVWLGRSAVVTRKQGLSRSPGLKISSGEMAWSMWGQSSLARAAFAASPFSLESKQEEESMRNMD